MVKLLPFIEVSFVAFCDGTIITLRSFVYALSGFFSSRIWGISRFSSVIMDKHLRMQNNNKNNEMMRDLKYNSDPASHIHG